jgi:hypothetical protein
VGPKPRRGRPPKETLTVRRERDAQEQEQQMTFLAAERAELEDLLDRGPRQPIIPPAELKDLWDASAWGFKGESLILPSES